MSKRTLDLNCPVQTLEGGEVDGLTLGKILASYLMDSDKGDSIRLYTVSQELWQDKAVEIDEDLLDFIAGLLQAPDCQLKNIYSAQIRQKIIESNLNKTK